jgi:hypothetical protein
MIPFIAAGNYNGKKHRRSNHPSQRITAKKVKMLTPD